MPTREAPQKICGSNSLIPYKMPQGSGKGKARRPDNHWTTEEVLLAIFFRSREVEAQKIAAIVDERCGGILDDILLGCRYMWRGGWAGEDGQK